MVLINLGFAIVFYLGFRIVYFIVYTVFMELLKRERSVVAFFLFSFYGSF